MATMEVKVSPEDIKASQQSLHVPAPSIAIIFGASGDLTKRKPLPALFHLEQAGLSAEGVRRGRGGSPPPRGRSFAADMQEGIVQFGGGQSRLSEAQGLFLERVVYYAMGFDDHGWICSVSKELLEKIDRERGTQGQPPLRHGHRARSIFPNHCPPGRAGMAQP